MGKQEFIDRLRAALNGRVSSAVLTENINYYEDYINTQIRLGRSEEEVLGSLGDPRLIARTIIQTSGQDAQDAGASGGYSESYYRESKDASRYTNYQDGENRKTFRVPGWLWMIAVILVIMLVVSAVFSMVSFLAPILIPIIFVLFLVKLFRDWLS